MADVDHVARAAARILARALYAVLRLMVLAGLLMTAAALARRDYLDAALGALWTLWVVYETIRTADLIDRAG